jgi:sugar phosphate permease
MKFLFYFVNIYIGGLSIDFILGGKITLIVMLVLNAIINLLYTCSTNFFSFLFLASFAAFCSSAGWLCIGKLTRNWFLREKWGTCIGILTTSFFLFFFNILIY